MSPPLPTRHLKLRRAALAPPPVPEGPDLRPRRSRTPWHGFSAGDWPREAPLPRCPSPRCRRAKACLAAVNGLYCQRTHLSLEEQVLHWPRHPLARAFASVPRLLDPDDPAARAARVLELAEARLAHDRAMTAQWKKGLLDPRFGPYKASGIVLAPPPRVYVEEGRKRR